MKYPRCAVCLIYIDYFLTCGFLRKRRPKPVGPLKYEDIYRPDYVEDMHEIRVNLDARKEFDSTRLATESDDRVTPGYVKNMAEAKLRDGPRKAFRRESNIE